MFLIPSSIESGRPALVEGATGTVLTYGDLRDRVAERAAELACAERQLAFCFTRNDVASIVTYLAVIEAGHAVFLLDSSTAPDFVAHLLDRYRPEWVLHSPDGHQGVLHERGYEPIDSQAGAANWSLKPPEPQPMASDLALLLSTSGTTGSPKLVRLSAKNIASNALSIVNALGIDERERAVTSLPISYSYGLSVLNSHLAAGATIVTTNESVLTPAFWEVFRTHGCTSLAGVPYSYAILKRMGFDPADAPTLRVMTQAGGRLAPELIRFFSELIGARGGRFFVMYGQTEATARMAVLPADQLPARLGSAGRAIPGGRFEVVDAEARPVDPGITGEIVYHGPNVMMGYAWDRADLGRGDELGGRLATGDLGYVDPEGYLYITGRLKRIAKLFGTRVDLDEVERLVSIEGPVAVTGTDDQIVVFCEHGDEQSLERARKALARRLKLNYRALRFRRLDTLPLGSNGKIDYSRLQAEM